jgi:hypothetical protein
MSEEILELARKAMASAGLPDGLETLDAQQAARSKVRQARARALEHATLRQAEADAAKLAESRLGVAELRLDQLIASQRAQLP